MLPVSTLSVILYIQVLDLVPASKLNQLASQDYGVNVNVFSGRRSSQDNLLACDFFDGKISKIQPGITLRCGLIGEYNSQLISFTFPFSHYKTLQKKSLS